MVFLVGGDTAFDGIFCPLELYLLLSSMGSGSLDSVLTLR